MGMYTELVLKCTIKENAPQNVKDVIRHLFAGEDKPELLPDHEFFNLPRWKMIGSCASHYHHPEAVNSAPIYDYTDTIHIFSRSDLKNYNGEIDSFVNWITPYIYGFGDTCIGWQWYEEEEKPTLIIIKAGE